MPVGTDGRGTNPCFALLTAFDCLARLQMDPARDGCYHFAVGTWLDPLLVSSRWYVAEG